MEIISKFLLLTKSVIDQFYRRTTSVTFQVDIHVLQKTYKIKLLYKRDKFVCIITTLRLTSVSKRIRKDMFKLYPVGAFCIIQRRFKQVVKQRQVVIWFMSSESWHAWFRFYVGRSILKITKWKLSKHRNCKIHFLQKQGIGKIIEIWILLQI